MLFPVAASSLVRKGGKEILPADTRQRKTPKALLAFGVLTFTGCYRTMKWWRWGELNPRPRILPCRCLHVYSRLSAYRACSPPGRGGFGTIRCFVSPIDPSKKSGAIPLVDVLPPSAGITGENSGLFMLPQHMHSHLRLYLKFYQCLRER